ncbi:MAG: DNA repair protein RecN [Leptolyngbya sp. SIO4C1]|nr:DNA repair protein RecN [Leptolyngbya sp. SIO4C1]
MLVSLKIENFALIDQLAIDLRPGLNVLTGETGAGKSIILDAIDAVLGSKATGRLVRTGAKKALVEATFEVRPAVAAWLEQHEIPAAALLSCRRELTAGKGAVRSRSKLNGVSINKAQMEELRQLLVEITAQGQTVQLGSADLQRDWLDGFGGQSILQQRQAVAAAHAAATAAWQALDRRQRAEQQRQQQLDLFEYQARELSSMNLDDPEELERLKQEQQRLSHSVDLQKQSYQVYQILYESDGTADACADLLGKVESILTDMQRFDSEVDPILELVSDALAQVEEAGRQVNTYGEGLETDPERLAEVDQRILQLKQLCRKYGRELPELIDYYQEIQAALEALNGDGQSMEALETAHQQAQQRLIDDCAKLTQLRRQTAQQLEQQLIAELKPLAMERVKFEVAIQPQAPSAAGADAITFLFSPNPGEPLQPLAEIASGGEMSRFLLALKACFSKVDPISTLVFDEIDVGVSGRVAQAIAEKLHQLSRQHQVLCVTHQPLVAAMADAHFRVGKQVVQAAKSKRRKAEAAVDPDERTVVRVMALDSEARREELAQLAGGRSHQEAIAFADSLLAQAETIRKAS